MIRFGVLFLFISLQLQAKDSVYNFTFGNPEKQNPTKIKDPPSQQIKLLSSESPANENFGPQKKSLFSSFNLHEPVKNAFKLLQNKFVNAFGFFDFSYFYSIGQLQHKNGFHQADLGKIVQLESHHLSLGLHLFTHLSLVADYGQGTAIQAKQFSRNGKIKSYLIGLQYDFLNQLPKRLTPFMSLKLAAFYKYSIYKFKYFPVYTNEGSDLFRWQMIRFPDEQSYQALSLKPTLEVKLGKYINLDLAVEKGWGMVSHRNYEYNIHSNVRSTAHSLNYLAGLSLAI